MRVSETRILSVGRASKFFSPNEPTYWFRQGSGYLIMKRLFDIFLSALVCITLLWWLLPVVALLIKLDSSGPVFFIQQRVGLRGKMFGCIKLRSMVVNKDADKKQACKNDPRITSFGKFLRLSCIDELPQFINVLLGHMSIVGPRPHMLSDCEDFSAQIDNYDLRHSMRPGITGMAQVKGYRGKTNSFFDVFHRYQWDAFYVRRANFYLDMRLIYRTFTQTLEAIAKLIKAKGKSSVQGIVDAINRGATNKTAFSIVIVVRDSSSSITRLLESVRGLSDDIVVCDAGACEATAEKARKAGARVYSVEWEGYGKTKNNATRFAKHDWILSLDAHEKPDEELYAMLKTWSPVNPNTVYQILWKNFFGDQWIRYSDLSTGWKDRLFHKQTVRWDDAVVHEELVSGKELQFVKLDGYLENYSFVDKAQYQEKMRNSAMLTAVNYHLKAKKSTVAHLLFSPLVCFLKTYVFKLGFLDGSYGWLIARTSASYSFLKYWTLWKLNHNKFSKNELEVFLPDTVLVSGQS